ncbi:MAG: hypothetical protein RR553_04435 [Akkermansia sp.]
MKPPQQSTSPHYATTTHKTAPFLTFSISSFRCYSIGEVRSQALWAQDVAGSNPVFPTI